MGVARVDPRLISGGPVAARWRRHALLRLKVKKAAGARRAYAVVRLIDPADLPQDRRDIGDGDLRDEISCMRYVFEHNYWQLIVGRRYSALAGAALIVTVGLLATWFSGHALLVTYPVTSGDPAVFPFSKVLTSDCAGADRRDVACDLFCSGLCTRDI